MPYSTYLPEHMGSVDTHAGGPVRRRLARRADADLHGRHVRHRRYRHAEGLLADHVRHEQAAVRQAAGRELHDGRSQQRRQARSLVRPTQHPALCQHAADPRRPRLSARGRHADDPLRRPPAGLARACGCRPMSRSRSNCRPRSMRSRPTSSARCRSSRRSTWCPAPAASWKAILPSLAVAGEPFRLALVAEDMWGNPTADRHDGSSSRPRSRSADLPEVAVSRGGRAARDRQSHRRGEGDIDLRSSARTARSSPAPIRCASSRAAPLRRYWGDLHGQSGETVGMGSAEDYFRYARDKAFVDIVGHQGNDFQITDEFWKSSIG